MPRYIVEIQFSGRGRPEMTRLARVIGSANARLGHVARVITASVRHHDGRLVCTVDAPDADAVRHLISTALLPSGRIDEVTTVIGPADGPSTA